MSLAASLRVAKQHVNVTVQSEPLEIKGFTDIDIHASSSHPPQVIFLNARQVTIERIISVGDGKEMTFQYIDSHAALLFKNGPLVRDASHFAAVCQIVNESPDLIIPYEGAYPVSLHIEFRVKSDSTSIVNKNGIIFTDNNADGPSGWFPCMDTIAQRSFFSLNVTCSQNYVCVGPGDSNLAAVDPQLKTNTMSYRIKYPVNATAVGFALGPFISQPLQTQSEQNRNDITMYYIGSVDESFRNTLEPVPMILQKIMDKFIFEEPFYTTLSFVSLPFLTETVLIPSVVFLPPSLNCPLGNANIIYDVVPKLIEAIIGIFIYFLFPVGEYRDQWLQHGLVSFFAEIFATELYSHSFYLDRRWNDLNWLMSEDIFPSIVLHKIDPATGEPFQDKYLRTKAKLLINMISTSMKNKEQQIVLLMRPLVKMCEEQSGFVTERFFMDLIRFCPNINFKTFRYQWLCSNGFPIFTYNFTNDNRHNNMKFVLAQTPSCKTDVKFFTGNILVALRDLEQPYEFQFAVENQIQLQMFNYFAHRRKTKTKKFTYVNGTEASVQVHHAVMWIILDQPMTWICRVRPRLPEFMIIYQLDLLHNVYAQHEAISSLEDFKDTENTLNKLTEMLKSDSVFYGVRCHVARALAKFNSEQAEFKHMQVLMDWYANQFLVINSANPQQITVKPHDFYDIPRHFVQLEVIKSLSIVRNSQNYSPEIIVKRLIVILEQANNNSNNMYNDDYFNAEVILAFGRLRPESETFYQATSSLILNKLSLHASIPSYCNIITSAGYTALTAISLKTEAYTPNVKEMRSVVLEETNYFDCRASVFRNLLFLCISNKGVTFAELVSDVKTLAMHRSLEMSAMCLREVYRFILNSVHIGDQDKFQTYLLVIPEGMNNDSIRKSLTSGNKSLEIAETLWEILTKFGQHHKRLRSEALRAYTTLYGEQLPTPYLQKSTPAQVPIELTAERSSGSVVQIDITRSAQARNAQHAAHAAQQAEKEAAAAAATQQQQNQQQQQQNQQHQQQNQQHQQQNQQHQQQNSLLQKNTKKSPGLSSSAADIINQQQQSQNSVSQQQQNNIPSSIKISLKKKNE